MTALLIDLVMSLTASGSTERHPRFQGNMLFVLLYITMAFATLAAADSESVLQNLYHTQYVFIIYFTQTGTTFVYTLTIIEGEKTDSP